MNLGDEAPAKMISMGFAEDMLACLAADCPAATVELRTLAEPEPGSEDIPVEQLARLWRAIAETMNDEFLGRGERSMPVGSFRLLCFCVQHAGSLKNAVPRMLDFLNILLGNFSGTLQIRGSNARITLHDSQTPTDAFALRMYWILVHGLSCWLIRQRIPLTRVDFASEVLAREADYRMFFGAPVRFGSGESCIEFGERFLHLPIRRSDAALKQFLRDAPANILISYRQDADWARKTRIILETILPENWPRIESVSRQLGLSTATLRRHLAYEGQSFQGIKDELRSNMAIALLADPSRNVMEVAQRTGFADAGAFYRAFRRWTGRTPRG